MNTEQAEPQAKAAHTPGPWAVMERSPEFPSWAVVSAMSGQVEIYSAPLTRETEANARLIAAAPELLEICVAIEAYAVPLRAGLLEQLRAAIAKAQP